MTGLRIEATQAGRFEKEESAFLDMGEAKELAAALAYMIEIAKGD